MTNVEDQPIYFMVYVERETSAMYCGNCGQENGNNNEYCVNCGAKLHSMAKEDKSIGKTGGVPGSPSGGRNNNHVIILILALLSTVVIAGIVGVSVYKINTMKTQTASTQAEAESKETAQSEPAAEAAPETEATSETGAVAAPVTADEAAESQTENKEQRTPADGNADKQMTYGGHTYEFVDDGVSTWQEAKTKCEEMGGHLVTITSEDETNALISLIQKGEVSIVYYWVGGYDTPENPNTFQWVTGEAFSYTNWATGQPDDHTWESGENEMYIGISKNGQFGDIGKWNDYRNDTSHVRGYICEWE